MPQLASSGFANVEVGVRVHLRDVETIDDVGDVTAPAPVEPGDVVANADDAFVVEVVLIPPRVPLD